MSLCMSGRPRPIADRKIRIAVVGCGRISKSHFAALASFPDDLELVGLCDVDGAVARAAGSERSVAWFTSIDEMLDEACPDVVVLCTPSGLHAGQAIAAAKRGVHVVTEKPMATRWADGLRMVSACDEAGTYLFVVKQNRSNSTIQLLKRAIDEERFGQIHLVQINVFWNRDQDYYDQAGWRGTWEFDGGAFMNQASHYVDLLDWLIGPVEQVQAMMSTSRKIETEDTGVVNIRWRNGALGALSVTMLTYPRNLEGSITIIGEKGTARIGGLAVNEIQEWTFSDQRDYDSRQAEASYDTTSVYGFGHPLYYRNVVETLRGCAIPQVDGREGLRSLELLVAAHRSARDGVSVSLPLER